MNTAEQTAHAIQRMQVRDISPSQRIRLVLPFVSEGGREELQLALADVEALTTANRYLAIQLADARDEIQRLHGVKAAA